MYRCICINTPTLVTRYLDKAFNLIHGEGASLNDENMMDPVKTTAKVMQTKCPDVGMEVIKLFTSVKYFSRIKALNEKTKIDIITERKRKAEVNNETQASKEKARLY